MSTTKAGDVKSSGQQRLRPPPHNIEAEQALLGALLIDNRAFERVADVIEAVEFFDPLHGQIYEVAGRLIGAGRLATPVTLKTFFENAEPIDKHLSVPQYLGRLASGATSLINARSYAETVHDLYVRRCLMLIGEDILVLADESPVDAAPEAQIEQAEAALAALADTAPTGDQELTFAAASAQALEAMSVAYQRGGSLNGLSSGIVDLDNKTGGLAPTDLIVIAGRPSMGKTALAMGMALHNAKQHLVTGGRDGCPAHVFSMEMSAPQLVARILSAQTEVASDKMRRGTISEEEFRKIMGEATALAKLPLTIDQTGGITLAKLAARARRVHRKSKTGLIVIDYLQLMAGIAKENRVQELTAITMGLKALAKELAVPVVMLSQLNRQVESRDDKRPRLADLRESGSIEQDADLVMLLFREEYYVEREKPPENNIDASTAWLQRMKACHGKAEVALAKHRHGQTGIVECAFQASTVSFSDLTRREMLPQERERHP